MVRQCCGGVIKGGVNYHHIACPNVALQAQIHAAGLCKCGPKGREAKCQSLDTDRARS
jgi:hypothetical protein